MIVNRFRVWAQTASPSLRADGASALARACLFSDLDDAQRTDAIQVLTSLLDDPSALVRRALAEAFASAVDAPHHIILALAEDQSSIAAIVLARSPVLTEAELIDCAATADACAQSAIASRPDLSAPTAAALAEVGAAEAVVALANNPTVHIPDFSFRRMIERHGARADLREALLARPDLPTTVRLELVTATTKALAAFVTGCNWMSEERMARVARETRDKAALVIADTSTCQNAATDLVAHLRSAGQLTVGFLLRAILSGKIEIFRAALANLSGMPLRRVDGLTEQCESTGFAALYRQASLPIELLPAFRVALRAVREADWTRTQGASLSRSVVERVLTACESVDSRELEKLIVVLRRFEAEAAREEARQPAMTAAKAALILGPSVSCEHDPLLLVEPEMFEEHSIDICEPVPAFAAYPRLTVDMGAIEAELCAA